MPIETRQQAIRRLEREQQERDERTRNDGIEAEQRIQSIFGQLSRSASTVFSNATTPFPEFEEETTDNLSTTNTDTMAHNEPNIKIPTYDGTGDVEAFAWQFEGYAEQMVWTEEVAVRQLRFALQGSALERYFHRWGITPPTNLHIALQSLKEIFGVYKREAGDFEGIFSLRQKTNETVDDFIDRYQKECLQIRGMVDETVKRSSFLRGLRVEICEKIPGTTGSFSETIAAAKAAERKHVALQERKKEQEAENPKSKTITIQTPTVTGYQGRNPWPTQNPRPTMGGAARPIWNTPRPQPAPYVNRPPFTPRILGPAPPNRNLGGVTNEAEDPIMKDLRKRLEAVTIGSMQHEAIKNEARSQGRCLYCFGQGHFARLCPNRRYPANTVQTQEEYQREIDYARELLQYEDEYGSVDPESAQ